MRKATCLLGALGLVTLTAGCVQDSQYPATGHSPGVTAPYSSGPAYTTNSPGYGYTTAAPRSQTAWDSSRRDYDRDGIPNRYDRDANGDGVPDRYQGRPAPR